MRNENCFNIYANREVGAKGTQKPTMDGKLIFIRGLLDRRVVKIELEGLAFFFF